MTKPSDFKEIFIIRIWWEPREIVDADPEWRGEIEHVASGKRWYFKNLSDIQGYLQTFIESD